MYAKESGRMNKLGFVSGEVAQIDKDWIRLRTGGARK